MIGEWVRAERERRNWSQSELARRARLTQPAINKLEAGRQRSVQARTMAGLARAFEMTEDAIYRAVYGADVPVLPTPADLRAAGVPENEIATLLRIWPQLSLERRAILVQMALQLAEPPPRQTRRPHQTQPPEVTDGDGPPGRQPARAAQTLSRFRC